MLYLLSRSDCLKALHSAPCAATEQICWPSPARVITRPLELVRYRCGDDDDDDDDDGLSFNGYTR